MPTYEYRCPNGHEFDAQRRMAEHASAPCPECGEEAQQVFRSKPNFELKGEGWPGKKNKQYSTRRG